MKIHEVESRVGITKKNIRFYEEQALLAPRRNKENGYREYDDADVQRLLHIKMFRKLGLPMEEIRLMLSGTHTLPDGMCRHLIALERERKNLEQSILFCKELRDSGSTLSALDPDTILARMETMEREGVSFRNRQAKDIRIRYIAPAIITLITVSFLIGIIFLILWSYQTGPADAPPIWFLILVIAIAITVAIGIMAAFLQRIREILKGEIDDAKHY